jgi:glucose dehydrogenase
MKTRNTIREVFLLAMLLSCVPCFAETASPDDGQWTMPAKNYESTRFSGLDLINTTNVTGLKVAWTFDTGVNRGQEAAPLIVSNTMYVVTPFPNLVYALDLPSNATMK